MGSCLIHFRQETSNCNHVGKPRLLTLSPNHHQNCLFGIMTVAQLVKLRAETLIPTSTLAPSTGILSVSETTNWFSVTPTNTISYQLKLTIVKPAKKPWIKPPTKPHGLVLNKNILFWVKICIHSVGLRMDFLDLKDHTIAV